VGAPRPRRPRSPTHRDVDGQPRHRHAREGLPQQDVEAHLPDCHGPLPVLVVLVALVDRVPAHVGDADGVWRRNTGDEKSNKKTVGNAIVGNDDVQLRTLLLKVLWGAQAEQQDDKNPRKSEDVFFPDHENTPGCRVNTMYVPAHARQSPMFRARQFETVCVTTCFNALPSAQSRVERGKRRAATPRQPPTHHQRGHSVGCTMKTWMEPR